MSFAAVFGHNDSDRICRVVGIDGYALTTYLLQTYYLLLTPYYFHLHILLTTYYLLLTTYHLTNLLAPHSLNISLNSTIILLGPSMLISPPLGRSRSTILKTVAESVMANPVTMSQSSLSI